MIKSLKKPNKKYGLILWALDPFEVDPRKLLPTANAIQLLRGSKKVPILPTSIVLPIELRWPMELASSVTTQLVRVTQRQLRAVLESTGVMDSRRPEVLLQSTSSVRQGAIDLVNHASSSGAEVIAISSHGRRGWERLRLGSFTEIVLTHSRIPVLTVNPNATPSKRLQTLSFATDFSPHSKKAFLHAVQWAKDRNAKIKVLHAITMTPRNVPIGFESLMVTPAVFDHAIAQEERAQLDAGNKLLDFARKKGVEAELVISKDGGSIANQIVWMAEKCHSDLLVVSAAHSPLSMTFLGGLLREVIATAKCPVLVVPAKSSSKNP